MIATNLYRNGDLLFCLCGMPFFIVVEDHYECVQCRATVPNMDVAVADRAEV